MRLKHENSGSDALEWERQVAINAARLPFLEKDGSWALRLIHLSLHGPETVWDFLSSDNCSYVTVTRFLEPIRLKWARLGYPTDPIRGVSREICQAELPLREPIMLEVERGVIWGCRQGLRNNTDVDHYFLWYRELTGATRIAAISNPFSEPHTESWQRLINRSIGAGLFSPRRFVANYSVST